MRVTPEVVDEVFKDPGNLDEDGWLPRGLRFISEVGKCPGCGVDSGSENQAGICLCISCYLGTPEWVALLREDLVDIASEFADSVSGPDASKTTLEPNTEDL